MVGIESPRGREYCNTEAPSKSRATEWACRRRLQIVVRGIRELPERARDASTELRQYDMGRAPYRWFIGLGPNDPQAGDTGANIGADHQPAFLEPNQGSSKGGVAGRRLGLRSPEPLGADAPPGRLAELPKLPEDPLLQPAQDRVFGRLFFLFQDNRAFCQEISIVTNLRSPVCSLMQWFDVLDRLGAAFAVLAGHVS